MAPSGTGRENQQQTHNRIVHTRAQGQGGQDGVFIHCRTCFIGRHSFDVDVHCLMKSVPSARVSFHLSYKYNDCPRSAPHYACL